MQPPWAAPSPPGPENPSEIDYRNALILSFFYPMDLWSGKQLITGPTSLVSASDGADMASKSKRAALYLRVSTDGQTVDNQRLALEAVCDQRGWEVVEVYADNGVSGAKGRNQRPGLDALLKDASRGRFNVVLAWALDRLGRSLMDLLDTLSELDAVCVALVLHQQAIDTTTPAGRMFFQVTGAFAEFERGMIRSRVMAGLNAQGREVCVSGGRGPEPRSRPPYGRGLSGRRYQEGRQGDRCRQRDGVADQSGYEVKDAS